VDLYVLSASFSCAFFSSSAAFSLGLIPGIGYA
jgi:hypothetical protein